MAIPLWQSDPELQRLRAAVLADSGPRRIDTGIGRAPVRSSAALQAYGAYVNQHGPRLGVPKGYGVDPDTNELFKEQGIPWKQIGLTSAALLGGAWAAPAIMGAMGGAAGPGLASADALAGGGAGSAAAGEAAATAAAAKAAAAAGGTKAAGAVWGGLTASDLLGKGSNLVGTLLADRAQNNAATTQAASDAAALAFLTRQYEEQKALEQARWDANESRRAPYREASHATLGQLRALTSGVESGPVRRTAT